MTQYLQIAIALAAMLIGAAGGWGAKGEWTRGEIAAAEKRAGKAETALANERAAWERASRASAEAERETERLRRLARDKEVARVQADSESDAARAAAYRRTAGQLRDHVARLAARADEGGGDTCVAPGGTPAAGPGLVLAELYRGADDEAFELAEALDRSRRAGLACERIHDGLTSRAPP